jgi:hypothetical protein
MAQLTLDQLAQQTRAVVTQVNDFLRGDLAAYRREVEAAQVTLFGKIDPVDLDR